MTVETGVDMTVAVDKVFYNPQTAPPDLSLPNGLLYRDLHPRCNYGAASGISDWHLILLFTVKIGHARAASSSKAGRKGSRTQRSWTSWTSGAFVLPEACTE